MANSPLPASVTVPASAAAAAVKAGAATAVADVKSDVLAEAKSKPYVLVAVSFGLGVITAALLNHFLGISI